MSSVSRSPFAHPFFRPPPTATEPLSLSRTVASPRTLPASFAERFCRSHGVTADRYEEEMLVRCLYPHARAMRHLIRFFAPRYFVPDRDFLREVGGLRNRRWFRYEVEDFFSVGGAARFWRQTLRLRVSVDRVRTELDACWGYD